MVVLAKRMEVEMWYFLTSLVMCALVLATLLAGIVAFVEVDNKVEGKSLWLKMFMYAGVVASFTAVFYAVCWLAAVVLK